MTRVTGALSAQTFFSPNEGDYPLEGLYNKMFETFNKKKRISHIS